MGLTGRDHDTEYSGFIILLKQIYGSIWLFGPYKIALPATCGLQAAGWKALMYTIKFSTFYMISYVSEIRHWHPRGGGYSGMIWVGTCCWDLKNRPIFIPNFVKKWDPFLYQSHKFQANFTENFTLFDFQANFWNFGIRLMKLGLFPRKFLKILKTWPMFCTE